MIRKLTTQVADALDHETATHTLSTYIRSVFCEQCGSDPHCADAIESRTELSVAFIRQYVQATPMLLDAVMKGAHDAGVIGELVPVLTAAADYFMQSADFMPEHLGLLGMVDDSYLTHSMLQALSESHQIRTGSSLLPFDLGPANSLMRRMIGEPTATALDAAVREAIGLPNVQVARERLASKVKSLKLAQSQCINAPQTWADDMDIHLGALAGQ
jgi:uncharacterized membrane protein YkvA (DUF1232 family)